MHFYVLKIFFNLSFDFRFSKIEKILKKSSLENFNLELKFLVGDECCFCGLRAVDSIDIPLMDPNDHPW